MEKDKNFSQVKKILEKIKEMIDDKNIGQREFALQCNKLGYAVSQSAISKILAGTQKLTVEHLEMFAEALGMPFGTFMEICCRTESSGKLFLHLGLGGQYLATNPEKEAAIYNGYLGDFYTYFLSTSKTEQGQVIEGKLNLKLTEGYCKAKMGINTDAGVKTYVGQMLISKEMKVGYLFLLNPRSGEITSIYIRYRRMSGNLKVRLGLMLTVSAGDNALPTVGYFLLNRKQIPKNNLKDVAYMLKMQRDYYLIPDYGEGLNWPFELDVQPRRANLYNVNASILERMIEKGDNLESYMNALSWLKEKSLNSIEHEEVNEKIDLSFFHAIASRERYVGGG